ncbi:hypothetical protein F2Q68_00026316 [Brassica cretica]|uniref:Uncharacterized protein n=1 Tax=Brassica cretica TaxID=69181 RepID=A0A8S9IDB6_BRACR|nr:hypothetical protein F2Q68_00026316 [Brassica cretica]
MSSSFNFPCSTTTANDLEDLYKTYGVDPAVDLDLAGMTETPETVREGYCGAYLSFFHSCGFIFPVPEPILEILAELGLSLTHILPNFLRHLVAFLVRAREEGLSFGLSEFRQLVLVDRASMGEFDFSRLPRSWAENIALSRSSSMSDGIRGLIGILRGGRSNWSSFDKTQIRTVFAMPEGINRFPLVGDSDDEAEHSQEVIATPSVQVQSSDRLTRLLVRRLSFRTSGSVSRGQASRKSPLISIHDSDDENASGERLSPFLLSPGSEDETVTATRKRRRSSKGALPASSRLRFIPEGDVICLRPR